MENQEYLMKLTTSNMDSFNIIPGSKMSRAVCGTISESQLCLAIEERF